MSDQGQAPRPNLPSLSSSTKLTPLVGNPSPIGSTSPVQQIKLPPISFLSNPSSAHGSQSPLLPQQSVGSQQGSPGSSSSMFHRPRFSSVNGFLNNDTGKDSQYQSPSLKSDHSSPVLQNLSHQPTPILASSGSLDSTKSSSVFNNGHQQHQKISSNTSNNSNATYNHNISQQQLQPLPSQTYKPQPPPSQTSSLPQPQSQTQSQPAASISTTSQTQQAATAAALQLKQENTKPDVPEESDEAIIKYYEDKYNLKDFTLEEKHDILQHEKRARVEKLRNPHYKTFLCYSIIKRLNAVPPVVAPAVTSTVPVAVREPKLPPQSDVLQPVSKSNLNVESPPKSTGSFASTVSSSSKPAVQEKQKFVKREVKVNNADVLEYASKFPRKHLGSIIYTPTPTKETHKQLRDFQDIEISEDEKTRIVPLLPELNTYINSIVTVRIPSFQIIDLLNNENYNKRAIWGTDVYTDDSDILLVLKHNGFLPTQDSEVEQLIPNEGSVKSTPGNLLNTQNIQQNVSNFKHFLNIIGGDIHVDLIILPRLTTYKGIFRNGLNSRDWETGHDGVSFALFGVRYGDKNSAVDSSNDVSIKKRKLQELYQMEHASNNDEKSQEPSWELDYKAWRTVKQQVELGKDSSSPEVEAVAGSSSDSANKDTDSSAKKVAEEITVSTSSA
ncbi:hypothetical protein WICPIJ_005266 [Wickerhamomyces pijperi]|uniref:Uncharacterized protein n=1 Tax=Wickerhamomyces pijperi TaxID=599730 RepID=A0A9P8Q3W6_WICPI|nr:hypothetical protein WICPIJ_005266 [Wickerhamomyces pijperi]